MTKSRKKYGKCLKARCGRDRPYRNLLAVVAEGNSGRIVRGKTPARINARQWENLSGLVLPGSQGIQMQQIYIQP